MMYPLSALFFTWLVNLSTGADSSRDLVLAIEYTAYKCARGEGSHLSTTTPTRQAHMREKLALMSNNLTVVSYINKQGSTVSLSKCLLVREIKPESEAIHTDLKARLISSREIVLSDQLGHKDQVIVIFGFPVVDMFAMDLIGNF